ncbi:hypothetical protein DERF_003957 [Dermatophagoides farinae]|uniref:Calponin-homology (CH) domain-containing protein n=1 Tax=Dermatophagoides farinae TaxID=6954 RepID=A0A922LCT2_DERFA|nr:hypothetical protein DERF_003957 [Dermatophagoides farinae]
MDNRRISIYLPINNEENTYNESLPTIDHENIDFDDDGQEEFDSNIEFIFDNTKENNNGFKLPPRLAARLLMNKKPTSLPSQALPNIHNDRHVVNDNNENDRRQTMFIRHNTKKHDIDTASISSLDSVGDEISKSIPMFPDDSRYVTWINSVLATSFLIENITVDTARIINDCFISESAKYKGSTSKTNQIEVLKDGITSIAYREQQLMDKLRQKATAFFHCDQIANAKEALFEDIKFARYFIRKDRAIHMDVGSKKHILEVLMNYNPLWLKVALETIFNGIINDHSKNEVRCLVQFLTQHLLSFKEVAKRKNKNITTYFMNENNVKLAKEHIFFHFVLIVHFLDVAKRNRLIDHDPCLFRINAVYKSSRDIIISFSREYITGVGDITKSLRNAGIHLEHVQQPVEEFNFTATMLSKDLRCGLRLARILEIIYQRNDILPSLYYPSNNTTRKLHNMDIVFKMLQQVGIDFNYNGQTIAPKDICIGNRNKTIYLLDRLMQIFNLRQREIEYQKSLDKIVAIQRAFRRWIATQQERSLFLRKKVAAILIQRAFRSYRLTRECRQKFLCKKQASITIQRNWRGYHERKLYQTKRETTIMIQRRFRANREMKKCREQFQLQRQSAITIQQAFRSYCLTQECRQKFLRKKQASITIQRYWRGYHERKLYQTKRETAVMIQRRFRANREMKKCREQFQLQRQSAITIQRAFRSYRLTRECRQKFLCKKQASITIQRYWRGYHERKLYQSKRETTIMIQRRFRANREMKKCREQFQLQRQSAIIIQRTFKTYIWTREYRRQFVLMRQSAIVIQRYWRGYRERKRFIELRQSVMAIQRRFKANQLMRMDYRYFQKLKVATIFVQKKFRQNRQFTIDYHNYQSKKKSATLIQTWFRHCKQRKVINKWQTVVKTVVEQHKQKCENAAIKIQKFWRGYRVRREQREKINELQLILDRLDYANQTATENKKLINIIQKSIDRFRTATNIESVRRELENLEMATTYSIEICQIIVQTEWFMQVLINSFDHFNRSEPHKKLIGNILGIIINLLIRNDSIFLYNETVFEVMIRLLRNFPRSDFLLFRSLYILNLLLRNRQTFHCYKRNKHWIQILEAIVKKNAPKIAASRTKSVLELKKSSQILLNPINKFTLSIICSDLSKKIF